LHPSRFWLNSPIRDSFIHDSGYVGSIIIEMSFSL
jgi:hypothetical protein